MALTAAEKEANKIARNARLRAFNARRRERDAIYNAEKDRIYAEAQPAIDRSTADEERLEEAHKAELAVIDSQIAALQARRASAIEDFRTCRREVRVRGSAAVERRNNAIDELDKRLEEQFPDLVGPASWSAAVWQDRREHLCMEKCW